MSGVNLCSPCTFSAWCLIKHRDVVTISFHYHIKQWTRTKSCTQTALEAPPILVPTIHIFWKDFAHIKWVKDEAGTFKHFKSWGYFENFPKTTTFAMSGNHRPFMSQRVQFSCTIVWLWCNCHLLWGIYIFLLSLVSLHYFPKECCELFPYSVEEVSS